MDTAAKLALHLEKDARAKLEAVRLDLHFKLSMYKRQISQLETMISLIMEGIDEIKTEIEGLNDGTGTD